MHWHTAQCSRPARAPNSSSIRAAGGTDSLSIGVWRRFRRHNAHRNKGIFAVKYEPVKQLRPPLPRWASVFRGPQNTLPGNDYTARRGGLSAAPCVLPHGSAGEHAVGHGRDKGLTYCQAITCTGRAFGASERLCGRVWRQNMPEGPLTSGARPAEWTYAHISNPQSMRARPVSARGRRRLGLP